MSERISHFNIVERIGDDYFDDDDDDGAAVAAAASAEMMFWMPLPLPLLLPLIRPGLSYYCANRVHRRCQYPFLTEADNDQLDFLVHQLIDETIFRNSCGEAFTMDIFCCCCSSISHRWKFGVYFVLFGFFSLS